MIDYVNVGMPRALMNYLNWNYDHIKVLIETGTHRGYGAAKASEVFDVVYTIELSEELYRFSIEEHSSNNKIKFLLGNTPEVLRDIVPSIRQPYILFLDAHGSGGDTTYHEKYGRYGTPIIEELEAVKTNPPEIILIDDYKFYTDCDVVGYINDNLGLYENQLIQETPNWNFAFKKINYE